MNNLKSWSLLLLSFLAFGLQAQQPLVKISGSKSDCNSASAPITLTASQTFTATPVYTWSTGETTQSIVATPGTPVYSVTVTGSGLTSSTSYQPFYNLPPLEIGIYRIDSCAPSGSVLFPYAIAGIISNNAPIVWDNGAYTGYGLNNFTLGYHNVVATDIYGCTATASYYAEYGEAECGEMGGKIWADMNGNCAGNAGEGGIRLATIIVYNSQGQVAAQQRTSIDGQYHFNLVQGTYTVEVIPPSNLWEVCAYTSTVNVTSGGFTTANYYIKPKTLCPHLRVDMANSFLRRCFSGIYYMQYENTGTQTASNAYIDVAIDPFLSLINSDIPAIDLGNNNYRFSIGDVPVGGSGKIFFTVQVSCDAVLGQTHCTEAQIFPHDSCGPAYTGASLLLGATCTGDSVHFQITNVGLSAMPGPLRYVIIEDAVMLMQDVAGPALGAGEKYNIAFPANGATWRLEATQVPGHPGLSKPSVSVEACSNTGSFSVGYVNQFALDDADDWKDIDCSQNVFSYDPNDKQGYPLGYGNQHRILPGTDIEYMVRFQNTGTDTAFAVVIRDTLDANLDPRSIVPGAASHPYKFSFYGKNAIKFTFDPIILPDSASNQEASQGFVSYRISQRPNVPLGTDIKNRAAIYFDFNDAIYTNTTVHRVDRNFVTVSSWTPKVKNIELRVQPNPAQNVAQLNLDGLEPNAEWTLELVDAMGKVVYRRSVWGEKVEIERGSIPAGMYGFRVFSATHAKIGFGKLIFE